MCEIKVMSVFYQFNGVKYGLGKRVGEGVGKGSGGRKLKSFGGYEGRATQSEK